VNQGDAIILIMRTDETGDSVHKQPSGKTILLADDHRALRLLFSRKLAAAGHDVVQAATGEDALALARASTPDLVVLDVNMPKRNGYEVCTELRQSEQFADVPIILYSGDDTGDFVQRGRAAGADRCIRKTSKSSELLASIEEVFSQRIPSPSRDSADSSSRDEPSGLDQGFDFAVAMENADGDRELLDDLVTAMLEETPRLMERIRLAITQRDLDSLQRAAHSLKSSLAILGAGGASDAAARLESAGADRNLEHIDELHVELQTRVGDLTHALEKHVV
jgi:DNA-binding response OmpR family regulator